MLGCRWKGQFQSVVANYSSFVTLHMIHYIYESHYRAAPFDKKRVVV